MSSSDSPVYSSDPGTRPNPDPYSYVSGGFQNADLFSPQNVGFLSMNGFERFVQTPGTSTGSHSQEPAAMYSNSSGVRSFILLELSSLTAKSIRFPFSILLPRSKRLRPRHLRFQHPQPQHSRLRHPRPQYPRPQYPRLQPQQTRYSHITILWLFT